MRTPGDRRRVAARHDDVSAGRRGGGDVVANRHARRLASAASATRGPVANARIARRDALHSTRGCRHDREGAPLGARAEESDTRDARGDVSADPVFRPTTLRNSHPSIPLSTTYCTNDRRRPASSLTPTRSRENARSAFQGRDSARPPRPPSDARRGCPPRGARVSAVIPRRRTRRAHARAHRVNKNAAPASVTAEPATSRSRTRTRRDHDANASSPNRGACAPREPSSRTRRSGNRAFTFSPPKKSPLPSLNERKKSPRNASSSSPPRVFAPAQPVFEHRNTRRGDSPLSQKSVPARSSAENRLRSVDSRATTEERSSERSRSRAPVTSSTRSFLDAGQSNQKGDPAEAD